MHHLFKSNNKSLQLTCNIVSPSALWSPDLKPLLLVLRLRLNSATLTTSSTTEATLEITTHTTAATASRSITHHTIIRKRNHQKRMLHLFRDLIDILPSISGPVPTPRTTSAPPLTTGLDHQTAPALAIPPHPRDLIVRNTPMQETPPPITSIPSAPALTEASVSPMTPPLNPRTPTTPRLPRETALMDSALITDTSTSTLMAFLEPQD